MVRIDRWTKYYFGPRIGQTQAEGKNHVCQGGLFKASPHYTVSIYWTHFSSNLSCFSLGSGQNEFETQSNTKRKAPNALVRRLSFNMTIRRQRKRYWETDSTKKSLIEPLIINTLLKQESFDFFDDYTSTVKQNTDSELL